MSTTLIKTAGEFAAGIPEPVSFEFIFLVRMIVPSIETGEARAVFRPSVMALRLMRIYRGYRSSSLKRNGHSVFRVTLANDNTAAADTDAARPQCTLTPGQTLALLTLAARGSPSTADLRDRLRASRATLEDYGPPIDRRTGQPWRSGGGR